MGANTDQGRNLNTIRNAGTTSRLVSGLLVVVGDILFPSSDPNTFIGSHETLEYLKNNSMNKKNTQILGSPSKVTWSLWDRLLECVDILNGGYIE